MTDGNIKGSGHFDAAAIERFLGEWGLKIQDPSPDEEAEIIASRLGLKETRKIDPSHQQVP